MRKNTKKILKIGSVLFCCVLFAGIFCYIQNNLISISKIKIKTSKLNRQIKIIHLSDLHNKEFGKNNSILVNKIKVQKPDIIVFTGDLIDSNSTDINKSIKTLKEINKIAQIYYIPGNHEYRHGDPEELFEALEKEHIIVLNCKRKDIKVKEQSISILGMDENFGDGEAANKSLTELASIQGYKILLSHYPEKFSQVYSHYKADLVLSGHAHGGQFIIPFVGGLYAPGQGFFPEYYKGLYKKNGVNLVVSRGLGNSVIPIRLFNRPEIVVINLYP